MKFHFADIENQTITEGYTTVVIVDHEAEVPNDDAEAILLAARYGGVEVAKEIKRKITTTKLEPEIKDGD